MKNNTRKTGWWNKHWDKQVWVIVTVLLVLLITAWGFWASTYGTTSVGRDAEIQALIDTTDTWEKANEKLNRLKQIILANPVDVTKSETDLSKAEADVKTAKEKFETAGSIALHGELIILSGVLLQVIVALVLAKVAAKAVLTRRERIRRERNKGDIDKFRKGLTEKISAGQTPNQKNKEAAAKLVDDISKNISMFDVNKFRNALIEKLGVEQIQKDKQDINKLVDDNLINASRFDSDKLRDTLIEKISAWQMRKEIDKRVDENLINASIFDLDKLPQVLIEKIRAKQPLEKDEISNEISRFIKLIDKLVDPKAFDVDKLQWNWIDKIRNWIDKIHDSNGQRPLDENEITKFIEIVERINKLVDVKAFDVEKLQKNWIDKIHAGQPLKDEDEILKLIEDEVENSKFSPSDVLRSQQITTTYKRLMSKCRKAKPEEIPWLQISNSFYKLALICKQRTSQENDKWGQWELSTRKQYDELGRIIQHGSVNASTSAIFTPILFLIVFTSLNFDWKLLSVPTLGEQLAFWLPPILWVGAAVVANGMVHLWVAAFAHWVTEKTWTDFDDVIVTAIIGPLSALATAIFLLFALDILLGPGIPPREFGPFLTWTAHEATADVSRTLVVVLVGTWFAVFLLNRVLVWFMEQWAKRTTQIYDDMFVKMIQVFGTFILLAIGIGAALAVFSAPISQATGIDNVILPYTILVSVFTAIAGYAASAGFENFFGGLLLQIEKPFDRGERIILPDGQICDVRDVGMRSTVLYNVTEHSEVSVPNSKMAKMIIKNSSRPDLELRIAVPAWIAPGVRDLKIAGAILLDIAYLEREIDQMRVFGAELNTNESEKMKENLTLSSNRVTIEDGMERLVKRHIKIRKTIVSQIIGGGVAVPEPVFDMLGGDTQRDPWRKVLKSIEIARQNYQEILEEEKKWLLEGVEKLEGNKADDMLRNYRRAINEIVLSGSVLHPEELDAMISDVALRERIKEGNLPKVLQLLYDGKSTKTQIDKDILENIRKALKKFEDQRLGIVLYISDEVATLQNYIYAIGEQYSDVRPELDEIIGELAKEPSVSSEYSDDGHVRLTLSCYAIYLERRLEIQHKINRDIEWRFNSAGIKFDRQVNKTASSAMPMNKSANTRITSSHEK
jgi:small-conductance mechanosensitive channel